MKKLVCIISSFVFLFSFTSCAFIDRLQGDMRQLDYDEDHNLLYNDNAYYRADERFDVRTGENDKVIELGWQSQFPFFPDCIIMLLMKRIRSLFFVIMENLHYITKAYM